MCTVSVLPGARLILPPEDESMVARLVVSRDERRDRPRAHPPAPVAFDSRRAVAPIDPRGGGTWVALTDAGLAFALLNVNESSTRFDATRTSRGRIIPSIAGASDLAGCLARAGRLNPSDFNPCRLIVTDGRTIGEVVWRRDRLAVHSRPLDAPYIRVSSSLGDHRVRRRLDLFGRSFAPPRVPSRLQDDFHRHRWPRRGPSSVRMRRRDAETVSITTIELGTGGGMLAYRDVHGGTIGSEVRHELAFDGDRS